MHEQDIPFLDQKNIQKGDTANIRLILGKGRREGGFCQSVLGAKYCSV